MRNVGIVRRLDALGRIVIPREYRKMHRIELGDPLEIIAQDNGDITLRKVDINAELAGLGQLVCEAASNETGKTIMVGSSRVWLAGHGSGKGQFTETEMSAMLTKLISDRKSFSGKCEEIGLNNTDFSHVAISPIFGDIDSFGVVAMFDKQQISNDEVILVKTIAAIMGSNLQKY